MSEDIKSIASRRRRIESLVRKEINTLMKDKVSLFILFIIPVVIISTIGFGKVAILSQPINVWVIDYDNSTLSHELIDSLRANNLTVTTNYDYSNMSIEDFQSLAEKLLPTTRLDAYIIIHKGFGEELTVNSRTKLEVHVDAIDVLTKLESEALIQVALVKFQLTNMVFASDVFYFPEIQPSLDYTNLLQSTAPLLLSIMLFGTMTLVASQCIVGDVPLKRLLTTPVFRSEVVIGKTIAYSIISVFQIMLSLGILMLFRVPMQGLFIDVFLILFFCSFSGITLGVLFSTLSKTRLQAAQAQLFTFMIFQIIMIVAPNPVILPFIPLQQAQVAYSYIAYRGMSLWSVRYNIFYMLLDSGIFFLITLIYLKRKKEFV